LTFDKPADSAGRFETTKDTKYTKGGTKGVRRELKMVKDWLNSSGEIRQPEINLSKHYTQLF
jgi:hypothetical protein